MMIAYISLEYSSDGPSPSHIDRVLHGIGLRRHGTYYMVEEKSEGELHHALDRVHDQLKGTGVRYRVSLERPDKGAMAGRSREEVMRWVDSGLMEESIIDLLDKDVFEFKQEAMHALNDAMDHIVSLRRKELQEEKERRHLEAVKEEISILLRTTGGRTFQEVLEAFDMDEGTLEKVMEEMIDQGTISARQQGHLVIYTPAAPPVRPLAR